MKFAFYTLGCKVNQFETQAMQGLCLVRGHEIVEFDDYADVYIVNTCTVTATGDKKSRQAAHRARRLNPDAVVALCGCYSEVSPDTAKESSGADIVWGNRDHTGLLDAIEGLRSADYNPAAGFELLAAGGLEGRTRALLKVQDGCDNYCAYCKIPYARGHIRSLPPDVAISEAKRLSGEGYLEIVITGIEISSYGCGQNETGSLPEITKAVCGAASDARIRLGSLYPDSVDRHFCETLIKLPNLCRHFHLSLQSGCDKTLAAMNRRYDTSGYANSLALLREYFPDCSVTTDMICGFPGETEEDFTATLEFLRNCRFLNVHVFPYSLRAGTKAASMPEQVPAATAKERCARASQLVRSIRKEILESNIGKTFDVLFESRDGEVVTGYSRNYLPFSAPFSRGLEGSIKNITAAHLSGGYLIGISDRKD